MLGLIGRVGGVAVGLLALSAGAVAAEPVTLKYKWVKGEVIAYRMTQDTATEMKGLPGMGDQKGTQKQIMGTRMEVKDVADDGAATVETTFESVKLTMEQPGMGAMSYDSEKPGDGAGNPFAASFGAMIGERITFVIMPDGSVRKAEGMDKIIKKMAEAMDKENPGMGAMVADQLKGSFGDDAMRRTYEQAMKILPEKPVSAGDSWTTNFDQPLPMMGSMKTVVTSTYQGAETIDGRPVAKIANTMAVTMEPAKDAGPMGMQASMTQGKGTGVNYFDTGRGQLHRGTATMTMPMTLQMTGPDGNQMKIEQNITTTMLIERVEPKPAAKPDAKPADGDKK